MSKIKSLHARQILDSRGNPTVEVELVTTNNNVVFASVPSGASTGSREALELRDGDKSYYLGKSVRKVIENIETIIAPKIIDMSVFDLKKIDELMLALDGTPFKTNLGANATLAVSMAVCRAGAVEKNKPLFQYMKEDLNAPSLAGSLELPSPMMNIINGGMHASNNLDIQEFMIIPHLKNTFSENLRCGVEIFHHLKNVLSEKGYSTNVGDEGGFAPSLKSHEEALDLILESIKAAGYEPGKEVSLCLDVAASEFYNEEKKVYNFNSKEYSTQDMIEYYKEISSKYPIYSIEDGLAESDHEGWTELTKEIGKDVVLVGDDLFVTNPSIFSEGIKNGEANAILIKINQIGTISETMRAIAMAFENNYKVVVSHRSGETADHFISDLAVAVSSRHIKTGSASRSDRIEKYNQLLRIEESLGNKAIYTTVL